MRYSDIVLPKKSNGLTKTGDFSDVKIDDYMKQARKLLTDAENDAETQADAIQEICRHMAPYGPLKYTHCIDRLAKDFKIKKSLFALGMDEAKRKIAVESKGGNDDTPLINRVEKYIHEQYDIYYNEIANKFMYKRKAEGKYIEMNTDDIYCNLKKHHLNFPMGDLKSLLKSNFVTKIDAFKEYFESLKWDGNDHIAQLCEYIEVEEISPHSHEKERFKRMFLKMLVRMVACVIQAEVNKQCFTFVHGEQNSGKTTFLRWLCPPELKPYYSEIFGTSKDDLIALTENFIINMDELSSLSKYNINALKKVMSTDKVKVRLPYGERPVMLQRRCSFLASTNLLEFLNDETGSVRWVCFSLKNIIWNYKDDIKINNVWAQAYHLFQSHDFVYQLTSIEIKENEEANRTFLVRTPEMELIQKYLIPRTPKEYIDQGKEGPIRFMTSTEIMTLIHNKDSGCIKLSSINIGKSLALLGFTRGSSYNTNERMSLKGYFIEEKSGKADDVFQSLSDSLHLKENENRRTCQSGLPY